MASRPLRGQLVAGIITAEDAREVVLKTPAAPVTVRVLFAAMLLAWCGLHAEEMVVTGEGRFAAPGGNFAVEWRIADAAPVNPAQQPRVVTLPSVRERAAQWRTAHGVAVELDVCLVQHPLGLSVLTMVGANLRLTNSTDLPRNVTVVLAIAPEREVRALSFERHAFFIDGQPAAVADTPSRGAILAESALAPRPLTPQDSAHVTSAEGQCRGEMIYDLTLGPGQSQTLGWVFPSGGVVDLEFCRTLSIAELFDQARAGSSTAR